MAGESQQAVRDKALCAKMIRAGQEACDRGRPEEAKEYFRRAVKADPLSSRAWHYYDTSVVLVLAAELKKKQAPCAESALSDASKAAGQKKAKAPSPPPQPVDDEGC
jgi:tetratricopeptide (TPR) repeat protein